MAAQARPVARKEKFDYAGEGALVEDEGVRSACVKAATDLEVFFLSRQGLQECMSAHPSIKTIFANQKAKQELENKVTRTIVAGIWVAFFRECPQSATSPLRTGDGAAAEGDGVPADHLLRAGVHGE